MFEIAENKSNTEYLKQASEKVEISENLYK